MQKDEMVYMTVQYQNLETQSIQRHLQDWLVLVRLMFQPDQMTVNEEASTTFSLKRCHQLIDEVTYQSDLALKLSNGENEATFHLVNGNLLEKHLFSKALFLNQQKTITSYVEFQMATKGLFGYIRSYDEYLYNNVELIERRLQFESAKAVEQLPKIRLDDEIVVDCNQLSGYDIFYKGFCLTSCWRMYFSQRYHQIIPLKVIEDVQQVEKVVHLNENLLMVELYKDPFKWDEPLNLDYQRLFRDQMGIDHLAWDNGVGILREPFIEYAYSDSMIQTVSYQNERLQPTNKKAATHFVTRTYDILRGQYQEKRVKGVLNAQAYFPWVDEQGMKMMNYIVINPTYCLDQGLAAYQFYLRNYLEVNLSDERYRDYVAILNIYIPDDLIDQIPYDTLKKQMPDIKFSSFRKRKKRSYVDLIKEKNHLRVNFIPFTALDQIKANLVEG